MAKNPIVTIEMENGGKIVAELGPRSRLSPCATSSLWQTRASMTA